MKMENMKNKTKVILFFSIRLHNNTYSRPNIFMLMYFYSIFKHIFIILFERNYNNK